MSHDMPSQTSNVGNLALGLSVARVSNDREFYECLQLRYQGYGCFLQVADAEDSADCQENCVILIARDIHSKLAVGTIRLLDARNGPIELDRFFDVADADVGRSFVEASRFATEKGRVGAAAKLLLSKAAFLYVEKEGLEKVIIGTKPSYESFYLSIGFRRTSPERTFSLPLLGNAEHNVLEANVSEVREMLASNSSAYGHFLENSWHDINICGSYQRGQAHAHSTNSFLAV